MNEIGELLGCLAFGALLLLWIHAGDWDDSA